MKRGNVRKRKICVYCGSKKYIEFLNHEYIKGVKYYCCKNEDYCVLKMSLNKKYLKNKASDLFY